MPYPVAGMHHYTDKPGYNAIRATPTWLFKASQPPGDHPRGAYFTTLGPEVKNIALRLGIPKSKTEYVFAFEDAGDLTPLRGGRGEFILYSSTNYSVEESRQYAADERSEIATKSPE